MYTQIREEIARLRAEGRAEGLQEGHRDGHREGARALLLRQAAKKFGEDAAAQLAGVVGDVDGRERLDAMADAVIECDTVADVLARLAN